MKTIIVLLGVLPVLLIGAGCTTLPAAAGRTETPPPAVVETQAPEPIQAAYTDTPQSVVEITGVPATIILAGTVVPFSRTPLAQMTPARTVAPIAIPTYPSPASGQLSATELKYRILTRFGTIFFCDPDFYPVAREIPPDEIARRVAAIQNVPELYQTILKHLGIPATATLPPDQIQQVYTEYKTLNAIPLQPTANGYQFNIRIGTGKTGTAITGTIDFQGNITVTNQQQAVLMCPICLAAGTNIATPNGEIEVQNLRPSMPVWTVDANGVRQPAVVLRTAARPLASGAPLVHLILDNGRELIASAAHPAVDGRPIGSLMRGDDLDGAHVLRIEWIPNQGDATYDILPSGPTGAYWANGVLLGSTLSH